MNNTVNIKESMEEVLNGKRQPDLIVCSEKGWAMANESFKPRQDTSEK